MFFENKEKKYQSDSNTTFSCQYHVVFCPQYRRNVFTDGKEIRLKEMFLEIAKNKEFQILDMDIAPNRIHLLIDCNPRFGIMECVKALKRQTAHDMRNEFPDLVSKLPSLWTRSCFISTAGNVSDQAIVDYFESQKNK